MKVASSAPACRTSRYESSASRSPRGPRCRMPSPSRYMPERAGVRRVPLPLGHLGAVRPEPGQVLAALPTGDRAAGEERPLPQHRGGAPHRDQPAHQLAAARRRCPEWTSPARTARCPGRRRCCCRAGCGRSSSPASSIGTPVDTSRVSSMFRACRCRTAVTAGSSVSPSTPAVVRAVVRVAVPVAVAVRLVVPVLVRDQVAQREAVVAGDEVDGRERPAPVVGVQVGRAGQPVAEVAHPDPLAGPERAHGVPVLAVPLRPQWRELAHLVAALAEVPRLGDELHPRDDRVLVDDVEERRQLVHVVERAGQRRGQVEAEAVHVHLGHPVAQRVHQHLQHVRVADVERVAAAGVVRVPARVVRRAAGSSRRCRCRGSTASARSRRPPRCGCRRRRGSPRCRRRAAPAPSP